MKLLKPLALLLLVVALQSCDLIPKKPGLWKDDKIDASKREKFHALNNDLLKNIKAGDQSAIENMLSQSLLEGNYKRPVELLHNHMKEGTYSLSSEYYVVNQLKHGQLIKPNTDSVDLDYSATAKEMYIAFLLPQEPANKYMITLVYGKFDYGWKIDKMEIEKYSENGKNTVELYKDAQEKFAKGYYIDAVNSMGMARECAQPSDELKSPFNETMHNFYQNLVMSLNKHYVYPIKITSVPTHPSIFRVENQNVNGGTYPAVCYLSSINLKDTVALKRENESMKKVIGSIFPGIDKDKKYMLYNIYNQKPNVNTSAYSYDVTVKF